MTMVRIIEHRSALPNGLILAVHIRHDPGADPAVFDTIAVELFGQPQSPDAFPERLPVEEAFLQALAYAERAGITVVWLDDPGRYFPPDKRQVKMLARGRWRMGERSERQHDNASPTIPLDDLNAEDDE